VSESALECLREISVVQPKGIDLTSFTYRKGDAVKIAGEALNSDLVYQFSKKLDGSNLFQDVQLKAVNEDRRRGKTVFDVDIKLRGGEQ
jgi:hypothetical protein